MDREALGHLEGGTTGMPRGGSGGGQPGPLAAESPPWVAGKAEPCSLACRDSPLPSQELQVLLTCHKPLQMGFLMGFGPSERFLFPKQDRSWALFFVKWGYVAQPASLRKGNCFVNPERPWEVWCERLVGLGPRSLLGSLVLQRIHIHFPRSQAPDSQSLGLLAHPRACSLRHEDRSRAPLGARAQAGEQKEELGVLGGAALEPD